MRIFIPVTEDRGLASPVSPHFGSAPRFIIVNTETGTAEAIENRNLHHAHGMCQPLAALAGHAIDAIVVGGIGWGALSKLQAGGIDVFMSDQSTVEATLAALAAGTLRPVTPETACAHHGGAPAPRAGHPSEGGCGPHRHRHGQGRPGLPE